MTGIEARLGRLWPSAAWRPRLLWAADVVLVLTLIAIGSVSHQNERLTGHTWAWWSVGLALPLLGRRRRPAEAFAVIALVALLQWATAGLVFADCALLFALYSVASTQPLRTTAAAAAAIEIGIVLVILRWSPNFASTFVGLNAMALAAAAVGLNVRHRGARLASLHERAARLERERDQQGRLAAAAERSRIAREMHDIVAHNLSVMIALADGAGYAIEEDADRARAAMQTASRTGRQALTEMRRLLGVLRDESGGDDRAPQPGIEQVDALVEQVRAAGLPVVYVCAGAPSAPVPPGLELTAYRIVQEALTNTLKHAGAGATATVTLRWERGRLVVETHDTGSTPAGAVTEGGGLRGMRERAAVYDGAVQAGPDPAGGWRVRADLPLAATPSELPA